MYLRQTMGPYAQGPVALIARHSDECVFSADAMGLRPLWQLETKQDFVFSSEPGVVSVARDGLRAAADGPGPEVHGPDRSRPQALDAPPARRDAGRGPQALAGADRSGAGRAVRPRARDRRPARGPRDPGLHRRRSRGSGPGRGPRPRRLRLAARRRQARPADGGQRRRADRLAGLRRPARRALTGAPEPGRLLQGDGRGGHQPGDRPRARDRALLDARGLRPPPAADGPLVRQPRRSRPTSP